MAQTKALEFVKDMSKQITQTFNREYKTILKQFIMFREKTWALIDSLKDHSDRIVVAEKLVAQSFPVYDFRYRADPDSPFGLYDCLAPALKQHMRVPEAMLPPGYRQDISLLMF